MELYLLKTFVTVAAEGRLSRAAARLHLSQPAVSAHIKTLEEGLGLRLFERTPQGMTLTVAGKKLVVGAEATLASHRELLEDAMRIRGNVEGRLRLGIDANAADDRVGQLVAQLSERLPKLEVSLEHGVSRTVREGIFAGRFDAGLFNEAGPADPRLNAFEVSSFGRYLAAPPDLVAARPPVSWGRLAEVPWICPDSKASSCSHALQALFAEHGIRPQQIIHVDRERATRKLVASGVGVGLLHTYTALDAEARGEVTLVCEVPGTVRVMAGHLASRARDPVIEATVAALRSPV